VRLETISLLCNRVVRAFISKHKPAFLFMRRLIRSIVHISLIVLLKIALDYFAQLIWIIWITNMELHGSGNYTNPCNLFANTPHAFPRESEFYAKSVDPRNWIPPHLERTRSKRGTPRVGLPKVPVARSRFPKRRASSGTGPAVLRPRHEARELSRRSRSHFIKRSGDGGWRNRVRRPMSAEGRQKNRKRAANKTRCESHLLFSRSIVVCVQLASSRGLRSLEERPDV